MRLLLLATLLATGCGTTSEQSAAPSTIDSVHFTIDLWPGEGIPVIEARRAAIPLRASPDPSAPIVGSAAESVGVRLRFDSTRVQTIEPGILVTTGAITIAGRELGSVRHLTRAQYYAAHPDTTVALPAAAPFDLLQHRAEGTCFVRIGERVLDARRCPVLDAASVRSEREPVIRWWIGLRGIEGTFGWMIISDTTARSVRREF